ncbi:MAG: alpha/beta fold hydrolase [Burkholderiaceae bacterium]
MNLLELSPGNQLAYEYQAPASADGYTVVFINPITGDVALWNEQIVPALQAQGIGTLVYNFRGQAQSTYDPAVDLTDELIISDLRALLAAVNPPKPVLAGLSIGGLYAARAMLEGSPVAALVLINTLRRITPRLEWMNEASLRVMAVGGPNLMKDLFFQLLVGEPFQQANRANFLVEKPDYTPLPKDSGAWNLLTWMGKTDWDIDWAALSVPTLVVTGTQDRVFYDKPIVEELFSLLPDARHVQMHDAGHMLPAEQPAQFIAALTQFVQQLKA